MLVTLSRGADLASLRLEDDSRRWKKLHSYYAACLRFGACTLRCGGQTLCLAVVRDRCLLTHIRNRSKGCFFLALPATLVNKHIKREDESPSCSAYRTSPVIRPEMQVQSTLSRVSTTVDTLLTILECISDEKFWQRAFGQRILELGKRYFGNDFLLLSMGFYVACKLIYIYIYQKYARLTMVHLIKLFLRTQWQKLLAYLW